jgi:hypothetical protein
MRTSFLALNSLTSLVYHHSALMSNPFASFALEAEHVHASTTSAVSTSTMQCSAASESKKSPRKRGRLDATSTGLASSTAKKLKVADPPPAGGLQEKLSSAGYPEYPLRCIIVGHNPSAQGRWIIAPWYFSIAVQSI